MIGEEGINSLRVFSIETFDDTVVSFMETFNMFIMSVSQLIMLLVESIFLSNSSIIGELLNMFSIFSMKFINMILP